MGLLKSRCGNVILVFVGNNGVVVLSIVNRALHSKYFIEGEGWDVVQECVKHNEKASVYVVLDHSSQVYTRHLIPSTSRFIANSIVKRKVSGVVCREGFGAAFLLSESLRINCEGWEYMFVESRIEEESFGCLLDVICESASERLKGILLLSVELVDVARRIILQRDTGKRWAVFLVYTKVGDFRQIVLYENELFSSITIEVSQDEKSLPDVLAGKINQEVRNTVQSIVASYGLRDDSDVELYMVVPGSVKASLLTFDFRGAAINVFTPYELGKALEIQDCAHIGSVWCDTVMLCAIMQQHEHKLLLHTEKTLAFSKVQLFKRFALFPTFGAIFLTLALNALYALKVVYLVKQEAALVAQSKLLTGELSALHNDREFMRINEMYEIVNSYKSLSNSSFSPLEVIVPLSRLERENFDITSFFWNMAEDLGVTVRVGVTLKPGGSRRGLESKFSEIFDNYKFNSTFEVGDQASRRNLMIYLENE